MKNSIRGFLKIIITMILLIVVVTLMIVPVIFVYILFGIRATDNMTHKTEGFFINLLDKI